MKALFDASIEAKTFRAKALLSEIVGVLARFPELHSAYGGLVKAWPETSIGANTFLGIVRFSFLIELVKTPKIETTKFEVRWADRLGRDDPRFATYKECLEICLQLSDEAAKASRDPEKRKLLEAFSKYNIVPYELPLDYRTRTSTDSMHVRSNVQWLWGGVPRKAVLLRKFLLSKRVGEHRRTFDEAYGKIKVKTYLTDRVLTGGYKTNREKRWETHPASVHYALRRDCLEIEHKLVEQLCHFTGFPKEIREKLEEKKLVDVSPEPFLCPITLDPLSFSLFEQEILNPVQGKSSFQVGHLNPLKALSGDDTFGHTAKNIAWVSANGNRIQGSLSLQETRDLINRIAENYARTERKRARDHG